MTDPLTPAQRSERMSRVRGTRNKSTEQAVEAAMLAAGVEGWHVRPAGMLGKPDFYFPAHKLAVFVDGCFWHGCPICNRRIPATRTDFWRAKLEENRRRDNRQRRTLRRNGYHVMRVWEHDIRDGRWLGRLRGMITRIRKHAAADPVSPVV